MQVSQWLDTIVTLIVKVFTVTETEVVMKEISLFAKNVMLIVRKNDGVFVINQVPY